FFTPSVFTVSSSLSLHDALPIWAALLFLASQAISPGLKPWANRLRPLKGAKKPPAPAAAAGPRTVAGRRAGRRARRGSRDASGRDRKSTRLNSSHVKTSYAVSCL